MDIYEESEHPVEETIADIARKPISKLEKNWNPKNVRGIKYGCDQTRPYYWKKVCW